VYSVSARTFGNDEFSAENVCGQSKFETILALMDVASLVMNGSDLIAATWMNV
jgi:hypothetical protein